MKKIALLSAFFVVFAALFFYGNPTTSTAQKKLEFVGVKKCKLCHNKASSGKYYEVWEKQKHAKVFTVLKEDEQKDPKCQKCHTTGFGEPGGFISLEKTPDMINVQCESCHGPAELHQKSKSNNVVPYDHWKPVEEVCTSCHNDESPHWKPEKYIDKDGNKTGFDFEQAKKEIAHNIKKDDTK